MSSKIFPADAKGKIIMPNTREELLRLAMGDCDNADVHKVVYETAAKGLVHEATVTRCKNGLVVNFPEEYMRVREQDAMIIADDFPTDKITYVEKFGTTFDGARAEALEWLKNQDALVCMNFYSGNAKLGAGYDSLLAVPANAAFYAAVLADLQGFIPGNALPDSFNPRVIIYVVPPFRHTHYNGKQTVVHNRGGDTHEIFIFNLYPGHGKLGIYAALLHIGEQEKWATLHAATVKVITPYEMSAVIMHEGAPGGGKSEMLSLPMRQADGRILLAKHLDSDEQHSYNLSDSCVLHPVTDDMAVCPPELQNNSGRLVCADGEEGWLLGVRHIQSYGNAPLIEKITFHPPEPLLFINMDAKPGSTCLVWEHATDEEGTPCPNPRVAMPRRFNKHTDEEAVEVDVRSFGFRQPPCTKKRPTYGIAGLFHVLPPALAWLWRIAAPHGFSSGSPDSAPALISDGIGSFWAFAAGKRVHQANLLLEQILHTLRTRYVLMPNQYIGNYEVGFSAEWLAREYLARRGGARFNPGTLTESRCPLLGYSPVNVKIDGAYVPKPLLHTNLQPDVGDAAYDAGAKILADFFKEEIKRYLTPELNPLGRRIIEACLTNAKANIYAAIIPAPHR